MKLKSIKMLVKRTTYTMVEVSEENGYDMPLTLEEVVALAADMKECPKRFAESQDAEEQNLDEEVTIESFKFEEE